MMLFRPFEASDLKACLALFDENCPAYFAPNERAEFIEYLAQQPQEYSVLEQAGNIIAAFGLHLVAATTRINWIMVGKTHQKAGVGKIIMDEAIRCSKTCTVMYIAASQHSAPFFARFGAIQKKYLENGWGKDMHRIDMELPL